MIDRIINFFVRQKFAAFAITALLAGWGIYSLSQLSVNTIPDISNEQVRVITVSENLATEDVERLITHPVELEMANIPGVKEIRSVSKYGLSVVTVVFEPDMGTFLPRQLIKERLAAAAERIPEGVGKPEMAPIMSGLGEIYQYTVENDPESDSSYSPMELRTIQDWLIRRQLTGIDGVVEINSWGGYLKQYEVAVDPERLMSKGLTIMDVYDALKANNANTGGAYIEKQERAFFIRGEGLIASHDDIRQTLVKKVEGNPIRIGDVATVRNGHALRLGAVTHNGKGEAVTGQIMMLKGESSIDVIERVKARVDEVRKSLPEGVRIVPYYDRSGLIDRTTSTIWENLSLGAIIVIFVLVFLLGSWRSGSIVALVIPLSLLFAFGMMELFGVTVNLVSLGAIDFGIIVDGAVIIVEYVVYRIASANERLGQLTGVERRNAVDEITSASASRMMRTAFFGQLIILIVFIPILTLTGVEGKMFVPMATTFIFALLGAMVLCFTFVPAASAFLYRRAGGQEALQGPSKIMRRIDRLYHPSLRIALENRGKVLTGAILLFGLSIFLFDRLGGEFVHPILPPGTSLEQTKKTTTRLERILMEEFPEVTGVTTRIGAAEVPTDPMSLEMSDMMVNIKPKSEWESASTKAELLTAMREEMSVIPGIDIRFSQPIEMLFSQFLSGANADIAIKLYGSDLERLAELGERAGEQVQSVKGVSSVKVEKTLGSPRIVMRPNRNKLAEYGLTIDEVNQSFKAAFSGAKAGTVYEGMKRFDLVVRAEKDERSKLEDMKELRIRIPGGGQVPLKELARIEHETGVARISRENTQRRTTISVNTLNRDVESVVQDIQAKLDQNLPLPPGYRVEYSGDFKQLQKARNHLYWLVPIALILIFLLLYISLNSSRLVLMVLSAIPLAVTGGIFTLWLRGMPFSIPAGIGFIALFGIAVLNGMVLISFFEELREQSGSLKARVIEGSRLRLRPVLLTALTDILGFLPMAVSTSPGAEVQRPLATVVVGGLLTSTLLTLIILPILYSLFQKGGEEGRGKVPQNHTVTGMLLLLIGLPVLGQAQKAPTLSPEEAVDSALSAHPSIEAAKLGVRKNEAAKKGAYHIGPTRVYHGRSEWDREQGEGIRDQIGVSQSIPFPFTMKARAEFHEAKKKAAKAELDLQKARIERAVRLTYNELAYRIAIHDLWKRTERIHRDVLKAAKAQFRTGEIGRLERTSLKAKVRQTKMKVREAQSAERIQRAELAAQLYMEDSLNARIEPLEPMQSGGITPGNAEEHPVVKRKERAVETREATLKEQRRENWPTLEMRYKEQAVQGQGGFYGYSVGLAIPIDRLLTGANTETARLEMEREKARKRALGLEWKKRYQKVRSRYQEHLERLASFDEERLDEAELLMESARKRYGAGEIDQVSYVNYMDQAFRIRRAYLKAVRDLNRSIIEIQYLNAP